MVAVQVRIWPPKESMDLAFTEEEWRFREEVRQVYCENMLPEIPRKFAEGRQLSKDEKAT